MGHMLILLKWQLKEFVRHDIFTISKVKSIKLKLYTLKFKSMRVKFNKNEKHLRIALGFML